MQVSLFRSAEVLMAQYAAYHRDRRNIATHLVGIPLIFLSIALFLVHPLAGDMTWAWSLWLLTSLWYLTRGHLLLGLATATVNGLLVALAHALALRADAWALAPWLLALALFVLGWAFQFVGHYWEGRKPAFVDDLVGLLVGPMFVVGEVLMAAGLLGRLKLQIEAEVGPTR